MTLVHCLDKSDYKLDVLIKEGKTQGLQGESRERGTVAITFSVFTKHIKSLGEKKKKKRQGYAVAFSRDVPRLHFFFPPTWGFPGSTEATCDSFLNCMTNLNRFF